MITVFPSVSFEGITMIAEARKMVGNDKLGTTDARRIITEGKDKIGYPKYIFTVYGDNTSNDEYKISSGDNVDSEYQWTDKFWEINGI